MDADHPLAPGDRRLPRALGDVEWALGAAQQCPHQRQSLPRELRRRRVRAAGMPDQALVALVVELDDVEIPVDHVAGDDDSALLR